MEFFHSFIVQFHEFILCPMETNTLWDFFKLVNKYLQETRNKCIIELEETEYNNYIRE